MTITPRMLVSTTLASAALGGAVGALATNATTGAASPQAIAAAVQKVKDATADAHLAAIKETLQFELAKVNTLLTLVCDNTAAPSKVFICSGHP